MSRRGTEARRAAWALGHGAEEAVGRLLESHGWEVLERRWRGEAGEVDLVVRCPATNRVRFVEVKARPPEDPVGLEAVDARKLGRLRAAGEEWLAQHPSGQADLLVVLVHRGPRGWNATFLDAE